MDYPQHNLAETLAEVLPKAQLLGTVTTNAPGLSIAHVALPKGTTLQEVRVDLEKMLPNPRRTSATATFADAASFLDYVQRHAATGTTVWCSFDPQTFKLKFTAVIDEHTKELAGWRGHRAEFEPAMSAEWKAWKGSDKQAMSQIDFAEWIQEHETEINSSAAGMPSSLEMLKMATEFVANEERTLKSTVRLQSGGVRLTYIADPDAGTTESMQLFEKFALGIPVFHGGAAWAMTARLKYRQHQGSVKFFYELQRPDRVHQHAAVELIQTVRDGLAAVPMLMGSCA